MPPLSMSSMFTFDDFDSVFSLKAGKVFRLENSTDGSSLIVKLEENAAPQNLKYTLKAMKTVQDQPGKLLKDSEIQALRDYVGVEARILENMHETAKQVVIELRTALTMPGAWFKMNKAEGLTDVAAVSVGNRRDKQGLRTVVSALRAHGGLEALGQILAVDLFNGNGDRFSPKGPGLGADDAKVLTNPGNVMFSLKNGALTPTGLDAYDPFNAFRDLNRGLEDIERTSDQRWPGTLLGNSEESTRLRERFVGDVVSELEEAFGPRNRKVPWGTTRRLPRDSKARIQNGITAGIEKLQAKFADPAFLEKSPVQIKDRVARLGWSEDFVRELKRTLTAVVRAYESTATKFFRSPSEKSRRYLALIRQYLEMAGQPASRKFGYRGGEQVWSDEDARKHIADIIDPAKSADNVNPVGKTLRDIVINECKKSPIVMNGLRQR